MRNEIWVWLAAGALAVSGFCAVGAEPAGPTAEPAGSTAETASSAAKSSCADCHGEDGISTEPDLPIIGGQSATYLADALVEYRDKERPCPETEFRAGDKERAATDMCRIAKSLSEKEIAALSEELAAKPFIRARQCTDPGKVAAGKKLHEMYCHRCHDSSSSKDDDGGMLAGQHVQYLKGALTKIDQDKRKVPKKMKKKLDELSPEHKEALLEYYASFQ